MEQLHNQAATAQRQKTLLQQPSAQFDSALGSQRRSRLAQLETKFSADKTANV